MFSNLHSEPYESAQRFTEGDTLSADVLNDILDRIELTLKDITVSELIGTWDATQYMCTGGITGNNPDLYDNGRDADDNWISGYGCLASDAGTEEQRTVSQATLIDNIIAKRTDTVTISAISGEDNLFEWKQTNLNFIYNDSRSKEVKHHSEPNTHTCTVIGGAAILGCHLDESKWYDEPYNNVVQKRTYAAFMNIQRLSQDRIKLFWGPRRGGGILNTVILDKKSLPPKAPTALAVSQSSGTATLTWTAGDATETGYDVKRKNAADGTYASIGAPTDESYSDSSIIKGNNYWYRVFATNGNGTSIGSNVIQITYSNTPPSMNLASTISLNEGTTEVVDLAATDADDDSLTYAIASVSPGDDAGDFEISTAGVISFKTAPDFESPADYDADNVYDIEVSVTDGADTVTQTIGIVVTDVEGS